LSLRFTEFNERERAQQTKHHCSEMIRQALEKLDQSDVAEYKRAQSRWGHLLDEQILEEEFQGKRHHRHQKNVNH
jgi:hypothetical protein